MHGTEVDERFRVGRGLYSFDLDDDVVVSIAQEASLDAPDFQGLFAPEHAEHLRCGPDINLPEIASVSMCRNFGTYKGEQLRKMHTSLSLVDDFLPLPSLASFFAFFASSFSFSLASLAS